MKTTLAMLVLLAGCHNDSDAQRRELEAITVCRHTQGTDPAKREQCDRMYAAYQARWN